jgi:uncharacterized protein (DUF1810 family)
MVLHHTACYEARLEFLRKDQRNSHYGILMVLPQIRLRETVPTVFFALFLFVMTRCAMTQFWFFVMF